MIRPVSPQAGSVDLLHLGVRVMVMGPFTLSIGEVRGGVSLFCQVSESPGRRFAAMAGCCALVGMCVDRAGGEGYGLPAVSIQNGFSLISTSLFYFLYFDSFTY